MRLLEPGGTGSIRIAAIGDVAIVGSGRDRARTNGYDRVFETLVPTLSRAHLAFANLEMPVGESSWLRSGATAGFFHDAEVVAALARAGVHVVSLANNHVMDCGERGLRRTLDTCAAAGVATVGAGANLTAARSPWSTTVAGHRVVVLAYAVAGEDAARARRAGVAPLDDGLLREDLAHWRKQSDVLVVSVHWGSMYVDYPPPYVLRKARLIESLGADLVLGHHPHVLQGFSRSGSTLTLFSLGDGAFTPGAGEIRAMEGAERRRSTGVFTALMAHSPGLEMEPFLLDADGFPHAVSSAMASSHRNHMRALAQGIREAEQRFLSESVPALVRYEIDAALQYLRQRRFDRLARLAAAVRPRHVAMIWRAAWRQRTGSA